ncbi:restriction endonuclease subunit S [Flavihumibacter sp. ZG627]|uniref:restriction endonuclease subunit S n=1 Tax=Flavihumibacter sp. ZG627 TaxID=1463156 RepID=UPI000693F2C8|nr:restriction endonuclease subunit S [Flavihumibacter sp. ZG627]
MKQQGWEIKQLADVVDFQRGLTYSKNDEVDFSDNIVLRSNNVDLKTNKLDFSELKYINSKIVIPESKKVTKGSLMICTANGSKSHLGKVALIDDDYGYAFGGFMGLIKPKENLNSDFLFHIMTSESYKKFIGTLSDGANINNLKFGDLGCFEIPIPPLPEQERIVTILEEAFVAIAKAKAKTEQNLKNAKELFQSYLDELFTKLFQTSEKKIISDVAKVIGGYSFKSTDFTTEGKYQVIRMGNVRPGIIRENESPVFIDKLNEKALTKALLLPNDVIITQTGTKKKRDYGFTAIIEKKNYLLNQRIASIRFSDKYLPKFFLYFSWTNLFKDQYFANETGTVGQGNVGIGAITDAEVPFIPVKDQKKVIDRIDELRIETQKLEAIYQNKIYDLEELKKSVLHKAFSGGLKQMQ